MTSLGEGASGQPDEGEADLNIELERLNTQVAAAKKQLADLGDLRTSLDSARIAEPRGRILNAHRATIGASVLLLLGVVVGPIVTDAVNDDPSKPCPEIIKAYSDGITDPAQLEFFLPGSDGESSVAKDEDAVRCGVTVQGIEAAAKAKKVQVP